MIRKKAAVDLLSREAQETQVLIKAIGQIQIRRAADRQVNRQAKVAAGVKENKIKVPLLNWNGSCSKEVPGLCRFPGISL